MAFLPHFVQNELDVSDDLLLLSYFNYCNPFDTAMPFADGAITMPDQEHLMGMSVVIPTTTTPPYVPYPHARGGTSGMILMRGGFQ